MAEVDPVILDSEEVHLVALEQRLRKAIQLRASEDESGAREELERILKTEPRLAEPRLELAHIHLLNGRFEEAHEHARLAVSTLRAGGQWTRDVAPPVLMAFALNLLGETLAWRLESGDLFLTDRPTFLRLWNEASGCLDRKSVV
jgi:thioredoxin-like negative regulator of GroEL